MLAKITARDSNASEARGLFDDARRLLVGHGEAADIVYLDLDVVEMEVADSSDPTLLLERCQEAAAFAIPRLRQAPRRILRPAAPP